MGRARLLHYSFHKIKRGDGGGTLRFRRCFSSTFPPRASPGLAKLKRRKFGSKGRPLSSNTPTVWCAPKEKRSRRAGRHAAAPVRGGAGKVRARGARQRKLTGSGFWRRFLQKDFVNPPVSVWLAGFGTLHLHCSKESERGSGWINPLLSPSLNLEGGGGGGGGGNSCQNRVAARTTIEQPHSVSTSCVNPVMGWPTFFFYSGLYDATSHKLLVPR